ncbi:MAG TPA: hypothetical protein VGJ20_18000 [Xanthobacteraceae bacterium]
MTAQHFLLEQDLRHSPIVAEMMSLPLWDGREWMQVNAELATPARDAMNARQRSVQMTARIVRAQRAPTRQHMAFVITADVKMLAATRVDRTAKPHTRQLIPQHGHATKNHLVCGPLASRILIFGGGAVMRSMPAGLPRNHSSI